VWFAADHLPKGEHAQEAGALSNPDDVMKKRMANVVPTNKLA
jgi:predicted transcriptional regulator